MSPSDKDDLQAQLADIDAQLASLQVEDRDNAAELDASAGPHDAEDGAQLMVAREENAAVQETLQQRRRALRDQLGLSD